MWIDKSHKFAIDKNTVWLERDEEQIRMYILWDIVYMQEVNSKDSEKCNRNSKLSHFLMSRICRLSMGCHTVSPAPVWVRIPGP